MVINLRSENSHRPFVEIKLFAVQKFDHNTSVIADRKNPHADRNIGRQTRSRRFSIFQFSDSGAQSYVQQQSASALLFVHIRMHSRLQNTSRSMHRNASMLTDRMMNGAGQVHPRWIRTYRFYYIFFLIRFFSVKRVCENALHLNVFEISIIHASGVVVVCMLINCVDGIATNELGNIACMQLNRW